MGYKRFPIFMTANRIGTRIALMKQFSIEYELTLLPKWQRIEENTCVYLLERRGIFIFGG